MPTSRQFEAWRVWQDMQLDCPDRHDWYQMVVACEVRRVLSRNPNVHQPGDLRLQFGEKPKAKMTAEQLAALGKAQMEARLGRRITTIPDDGRPDVFERKNGKH